MEWVSIITALASLVASCAAIWVIFVYREQVKVSLAQVKVGQDTLHDLHCPFLIPGTETFNPPRFIVNVGSGVALNIRGTVFFRNSAHSNENTSQVFALTLQKHLAKGDSMQTHPVMRDLTFNKDSMINEKLSLISKNADCHGRLILVYQDIFNQIFASVFDHYSIFNGWQFTGFSKDVPNEVIEIMDMSNQ